MVSDMTYQERLVEVERVFSVIAGEPLLANCFDICHYFPTYSHEDRMEKLIEWYEEGYEGLVHYDPQGEYEFGKRSDNTQKSKPRLDSEALVTGVALCKNKEGKLLLRCSDALDNVEFKAMMKGDHASRMYEVQGQFIGHWVTFKYEELSDKGVPTKPVVEETRLCDTSGSALE